jgi:hypothetical protein
VANELVSINSERTLTPDQYRDLADVPPELEWLAKITNPKTRRAYKVDFAEFITFTNLKDHSALRTVTRARRLLEAPCPGQATRTRTRSHSQCDKASGYV